MNYIQIIYKKKQMKSFSQVLLTTINQIYCYLDIDDKELNPYIAFKDYLENNFDLNRKILEVGSGCIPILAQYLNKYNLVLLEKNPLKEFYQNYNLIEESFSENTDITDYDIIIGYNPCGATESIIRNAIKNNKDFCIALCGCCFLPSEYKDRTPENWHRYLYEIAKDLGNNKYDISLDYFDKKLCIDWPIITGKFK